MIAANEANPSPARPTSARRWWPKIIAGLLIGHTTLMLYFVRIATHDAGFSVDPDYYGKAVRWDESQAQQRASDVLGWQSELLPIGPDDGQRRLVLTLADSAGKPINGAAVDVTYFHHAHGRDVRSAALAADPIDQTRFPAELVLPYAGEWEFHVTARAGGKVFLKTLTLELR